MSAVFPGPFCEELGISSEFLESDKLYPLPHGSLKNGHIIEFKQFCDRSNILTSNIVNWIRRLQPDSNANNSTLTYRITNLCQINKKLVSKKKVKGVKSVKEFKAVVFNVNEGCGKSGTKRKDELVESEELIPVNQSKSPPSVAAQNESDQSKLSIPDVQLQKDNNFLAFEIGKRQKELKKLETLVSAEQVTLNELKERKGHYAIRNVQKRDSRAQKSRQELNETRRKVHQQEKSIGAYRNRIKRLKTANRGLKQDLLITHNENEHARRSIMNSEEHVQQLMSENESFKNNLNEQSEVTNRKNQSVSYYKRTVNKLKSSAALVQLKKTVREKEKEINNLEARIAEEKSQAEKDSSVVTKNSNGSFTDNVRLCVIELAGLEVAVEKIPKVIQSVCGHIFSKDISIVALPTKTTVQTIIDEGHYLAKKYVASKIEEAESFGINRDGTTRKKQKILDTSVTLDSGECISLGFTRVSRETAKQINEVTKQHVEEMSSIQTKQMTDVQHEDYIRQTLQKLSFSMSDRASNEKAADRLLDEWRDEVLCLNTEPDTGSQRVMHFHCMAHVLLGFHKYSCDDVKKLDARLSSEKGPLGRDSLPQFKYWAKQGTVAERVVRTTSDTFGPAGDHLGLRDRWEAHCSEKGIKSTIGNYKDNRFNALFQTAAEVVLHADDMLDVLNTVQQPNRKLVAVKADLMCPIIRTILQCFGLFYIKVTGPYWNLVTSGVVPYLLLHKQIQRLAAFLGKCVKDPSTLMEDDCWPSDEVDLSEIPSLLRFEQALTVAPVDSDLQLEVISTVSAAMLRCVEKQLVDFLPGGQFSCTPTKEDLRRTSYAHSTNLGCEHHFGDLDSSQKRRPNASMHHHSTVQLLKRNRSGMIEWLDEMSSSEKENVMKTARVSGKRLRHDHLQQEKNVLKDIHREMECDKEKKKGKKRKRQEHTDVQCELDEPCVPEKEYALNEYVIVAYQDGWYPGIVECIDEKFLTVNFLAPTKAPGNFTWPARKDQQQVAREFVIRRDFVPECKNSGRMWQISDHQAISVEFAKYCRVYF